jgi:hypothetical protein
MKEETIALMHEFFTSANFTTVDPNFYRAYAAIPGLQLGSGKQESTIDTIPADTAFEILRSMTTKENTLQKQKLVVNLLNGPIYEYSTNEGTPECLFPVDYPLPLEELSKKVGNQEVIINFDMTFPDYRGKGDPLYDDTLTFTVNGRDASEEEYQALYKDIETMATALIAKSKEFRLVQAGTTVDETMEVIVNKLRPELEKAKENILRIEREVSEREQQAKLKERMKLDPQSERTLQAFEKFTQDNARAFCETLNQNDIDRLSERTREWVEKVRTQIPSATRGGAAAPAAGTYTPADRWTEKVDDEERHRTPAR